MRPVSRRINIEISVFSLMCWQSESGRLMGMNLRYLNLKRSLMAALVILTATTAIATPAPAAVTAATAVAAVAANDFTVSAPKMVPLNPGKSKTARINIKRGKTFTAPLAFTVNSPLSGVVVEIAAVTNNSARVRLTADTTVPNQTGQIQITATGAGITKTVAITIKITGGTGTPAAPAPAPAPAPAATTTTTVAAAAAPTTKPTPSTPFEIGARTFPSKAIPGSQIRVLVEVRVQPDVARPDVKMKLTGLPAGATVNQTEITSNRSAEFTVSFSKDVAVGTYKLSAEGTSGTVTAKAQTDPVEIRTTPLIQFGIDQKNTINITQGDTQKVKLFAWGIAGITPVKFSTDTPAPTDATITFTPIDEDGVATMTIATTPQTPVGYTAINIIGTGTNGTIANLRADLFIRPNGRTANFTLTSTFDQDPKNPDGYLQILPGFTTPFTVNVNASGAGQAPTVNVRFPTSPDYTVTPESITTDSTAKFQITFNKVNETGVDVQAIGTAGSIVQTTTKRIKVSGRPRIKPPCSTSVQFFRSPGVQSKTFRFTFSEVIGMPPPEILLSRQPYPEILNWTVGRINGVNIEITITILSDQRDVGRWPLGNIYAKNATRDPVGTSDPLAVTYIISNPGDADIATC
jgi:hypothetical protein